MQDYPQNTTVAFHGHQNPHAQAGFWLMALVLLRYEPSLFWVMILLHVDLAAREILLASVNLLIDYRSPLCCARNGGALLSAQVAFSS